jgi:hypothetical protein
VEFEPFSVEPTLHYYKILRCNYDTVMRTDLFPPKLETVDGSNAKWVDYQKTVETFHGKIEVKLLSGWKGQSLKSRRLFWARNHPLISSTNACVRTRTEHWLNDWYSRFDSQLQADFS